jgi:hypothetical protein
MRHIATERDLEVLNAKAAKAAAALEHQQQDEQLMQE